MAIKESLLLTKPIWHASLLGLAIYGTYEFTYYGCGESSESLTINFNTSEPEIITEADNRIGVIDALIDKDLVVKIRQKIPSMISF